MTRASRIALALAIVSLLAGSGGVVTRGGASTYELTAFFPRAIGLFPRSTVRVLGVEVGRVAQVVPEGDRVRVRMRVRDDVKIPADATAVIVPISLISDRYVQLTPVWKDGPSLRDGGTIPLERGVAPRELDDLLGTLKSFLEALEPGTPDHPGALGQLVRNSSRALAGKGPELAGTVDGLSTILDVLGRNAQHFDSTLVALDTIVGVLARRDAQVETINHGLSSVFGVLAEERAHLESGLKNVADLLDQAGSLVRDHRADLESDLVTLDKVGQLLVRQQDALVRNLLWLPVLSQGATQAFDTASKRVLVRDDQGARLGIASASISRLGEDGPGVGGTWLLWPGGAR